MKNNEESIHYNIDNDEWVTLSYCHFFYWWLYWLGEKGQEFRAEIEKKLEKWLEPLPLKKEKPLPAPDEKPRKHRGGRK